MSKLAIGGKELHGKSINLLSLFLMKLLHTKMVQGPKSLEKDNTQLRK